MSESFPRIRVDGETIPPEAFAFELSRLVRFYAEHLPEEQIRRQMPALRQRAIDQTIGAKLLIAEAARLDIQTTGEDVEQRVAAMVKQAGGAEKFAVLIKKQQMTEEQLREHVRRGRSVDLLVERIVSETPDPTEEEMRAHFDAHRDEYSRPERVLAQHILVKPADAGEDAREAARAKLKTIRERVMAGADFAAEAAAHSECPSGRKSGGSLGWFSRGMMVGEFENAVFDMSVGQLSEIIETPFGFHLIKKSAHEDSAPAEFDDAREGVREFMRHARRGELLAAHVAELRERAKIEELPTT
ncbi:MAG: peptidylprolyl isomerase [Kiritimatiellae bacterium]|nr:peptidylprolyl isomerase [Kiritimatiellia bacterium]